ncbi:hypothetical protein OOK13_01015 [Streptomyces sp. NBC_00378]|uniref:hypothetical protein n=1 Tax=unclassified Streptomyces TaxID=2593676 RepID=UPI00224CA049|nr:MULTISPECIES: hypothetical protein [unclassified Streptomyces]MCX5107155.1 hypothetical protein [Streptomyces sp. NBC_00378]
MVSPEMKKCLATCDDGVSLLPGADHVAHVDIDDTIRRTHYAKQGVVYRYSKVKGLNALLGIVSTPLAAPVIAATRLRKGPSNSARAHSRGRSNTVSFFELATDRVMGREAQQARPPGC